MRPLLICYDGSAEDESAIDMAAAVLEPRPAIVLNVAPRLTVAESLASTNSIIAGEAAFAGLNEADALRRARAGTRRARQAGLDAEARVRVAAPTSEGIVEAADEADAAVIVVGSRARSGLGKFAEGSVSHEVATHARRPILIVPRGANATTTTPILICYDGSEQARKAIETAGALIRAGGGRSRRRATADLRRLLRMAVRGAVGRFSRRHGCNPTRGDGSGGRPESRFRRRRNHPLRKDDPACDQRHRRRSRRERHRRRVTRPHRRA